MKKTFDFVLVNGRGMPNVSVSVYNYGTLTLATLWADSAGTIPLVNPVSTVANGYYEFYVADGRYSIGYSGTGVVSSELTDLIIDDTLDLSSTDVGKGASLVKFESGKTVQDLAGSAIGNGAALVSINDAGSKFTGTTVEAALQEVRTVAELASSAGASDVGISDAGGKFTGTTVEAALQETRTAAELSVAGGATLVGASDGSSGSLWTTVQGFITWMKGRWDALISSAGSELVGFIQSGTGAVATTVQAKARLDGIRVTEFGVVADSTNGQSVNIQKAIAAAVVSGRNLIFNYSGTGIYVIEAQTSTYCLDLPSNLTVFIEPGVTIKAATGIGIAVRMIQINGASNVHIVGYGATIQGIKAEYVSGEDRHGIRMQNAINVTVAGVTCKDTGGDGIYIGSVCENVKLMDVISDNNRRNNVTITGGKRIELDRVQLLNANGTDPQCGLDIEPNSNSDYMEDIVVRNCYSNGNAGYGYIISPNTLPGVNPRHVNVSVIDCVDDGSAGGFQVNKTFVSTYDISGAITFARCTARNTAQSGFSVRNYDSNSVPVFFEDCTVIDCSATVTAARYNSPFSVWNESTDTGATTIGNVHIIRPRIKYTGAVPNVVDFHMRALNGSVDNCSIIDPVMIGHPGTAGKLYQANLTAATNTRVVDPKELMTHEGTETLQDYYFGTTHKNTATAAAVFTLGAKSVGYPDLVFVCTDANGMTITPDAGSSIRTLGAAGKSVVTTQVGARLVLRRDSSTSWLVVEKIGTWRANEGTGTKTGNFTLGAAATTVVADTFISANSKIVPIPTNAAAATLMSGAKSLYVSAKTASTSFTVATADATAAAGTETFDYTITNP